MILGLAAKVYEFNHSTPAKPKYALASKVSSSVNYFTSFNRESPGTFNI